MVNFEKRGKKLYEEPSALAWHRYWCFYGISKCKPLSEHPLSQGRGNHCE